MAGVFPGLVREQIPEVCAQALLLADQACAALGLQFELTCKRCGKAWGSERTRQRHGQITHYEIDCDCKQRVYDRLIES